MPHDIALLCDGSRPKAAVWYDLSLNEKILLWPFVQMSMIRHTATCSRFSPIFWRLSTKLPTSYLFGYLPSYPRSQILSLIFLLLRSPSIIAVRRKQHTRFFHVSFMFFFMFLSHSFYVHLKWPIRRSARTTCVRATCSQKSIRDLIGRIMRVCPIFEHLFGQSRARKFGPRSLI